MGSDWQKKARRIFWKFIYFLSLWAGKPVELIEKLISNGSRQIRLPGHTLYHFWVSSYSWKTRRRIYRLKLDLPFKDILSDDQAYQDLVKLGGKDQVPCLRIDAPEGVQWMYESDDIISYLGSYPGVLSRGKGD